MRRWLVIGFGNKLRGDDGLGPHIVESLGDSLELRGADVRTVSLPQLDLTLAPEMLQADAVIFVDARADDSEELVKLEQIRPALGPMTLNHSSHTVGIRDLLRIALDWYCAAPMCYAVMPKGYDFAIGEAMSEKAEVAAAHARNKIVDLLQSEGRCVGARTRTRDRKLLRRGY